MVDGGPQRLAGGGTLSHARSRHFQHLLLIAVSTGGLMEKLMQDQIIIKNINEQLSRDIGTRPWAASARVFTCDSAGGTWKTSATAASPVQHAKSPPVNDRLLYQMAGGLHAPQTGGRDSGGCLVGGHVQSLWGARGRKEFQVQGVCLHV